ncbi:MAG: pyruvate kinase [Rhodospirillales bacterium]
MESNDANALLNDMREVRRHVVDEGEALVARWQPMIRRQAFAGSARNLAHYLAFRQLDLRPLQAALAPWGLASLSRKEGRLLPSLNAIIANLEVFSRVNEETERPTIEDFQRGTEALAENTAAIFGPDRDDRRTRILVTLSSRAGKKPKFVRRLVRAGMDAARINCAHDGPELWSAMIANVRQAADDDGRSCPVLMDLQGPKIRTETVVARKERNAEPGDRILLTFAEPKKNDRYAFQASCTMPGVFRQVRQGATVSIKDGLIRGWVEAVEPEGLVVEVARTPPGGQPFEKEKGINFPDTELDVMPLTEADLAALDFVAAHADIVGYSFVQRPQDVALLQSELEKRRPALPPMPIVAKIETKLAFANLPELIVQAAGANPFAVMIARGDLAVEIGYERLSEIQEEILWLCEAARVPVIWATQVLESLVKRGMPSRGEFTDAAMAERAECVMLNKGPYIEEGIAVLDNVLRRMETHRIKRSAQLRPLGAWDAVT